MAHSRLQLGILVPLKDDDAADFSIPSITIYEGFNTVGRGDLPVASKQVSRKHISVKASSDGSFEIIVEGQNPVILRTGTERHKLTSQTKAFLCIGDAIELLPKKHVFKLMAVSRETSDTERLVISSAEFSRDKKVVESSIGGVIADHAVEANRILIKRKRQEMEDESLAKALQAIESEAVKDAYTRHPCEHEQKTDRNSEKEFQKRSAAGVNRKSDLGEANEGRYSSTFQLLRVRGLPNLANDGCVGIQDVIQGDVVFAILSNYMVDLDWLLSACPLLKHVPRVVVIHGESGGSLERLKAGKLSGWVLHKPPLPLSYGTHHSKAMILIYPTGVRVIVHTANLIYVDWNNKTQGLWMQDFPYKSEPYSGESSPFENDLVEYLEALEWSGCAVSLPGRGDTQLNAAFFRKFDYSSACVRLIASVPGYHQGRRLKKWGHMKLRSILEQQLFEEEFVKSPLVFQFSSLGSLDEKWLAELNSSMCAGSTLDNKPLGLGSFQIVWPSVEDVRCSLEGYAAGNALPSPLKNVEKGFLRKYWARWQADHTGRSRAMPHIKSFVRYNGQSLAWFLLTSANLSKAAWGALQKNESQLMVRSYELGVLFLPSLARNGSQFSCTCETTQELRVLQEATDGSESDKKEHKIKLVTTCWESSKNNELPSNILRFPIPYRLPPQKYDSQDIPWSWERQYLHRDVYGELWPRSVNLYGSKDN